VDITVVTKEFVYRQRYRNRKVNPVKQCNRFSFKVSRPS